MTDGAKAKWKWNWGWGIALVYSVFALATIAFVIFSFTQEVDLVTPNYYTKAIQYDSQYQRLSNSQKLAAKVVFYYDVENRSLRLSFPKHVSAGSVHFYRPSSSLLDKTIGINCTEQNVMTVRTDEFASGVWRVKVEWESVGVKYYDEIRVDL